MKIHVVQKDVFHLPGIMESMYLVPRGLEGGSVEKIVPRPVSQQNPLPQPPKPTVAARPTLPPKPQVGRIVSCCVVSCIMSDLWVSFLNHLNPRVNIQQK